MAVTLLLLPILSNLISSLANLMIFQVLFPLIVKVVLVPAELKATCILSSEKLQVPATGPAYLLQEVSAPAPMKRALIAIKNSFFMISSLNKSTHSLELIQELV